MHTLCHAKISVRWPMTIIRKYGQCNSISWAHQINDVIANCACIIIYYCIMDSTPTILYIFVLVEKFPANFNAGLPLLYRAVQ